MQRIVDDLDIAIEAADGETAETGAQKADARARIHRCQLAKKMLEFISGICSALKGLSFLSVEIA